MIINNRQNLNNYHILDITNALDSVLVAFTTLCDPGVQNYDSRHPRPQTILNFPESRALEYPKSFFRSFGGFFF